MKTIISILFIFLFLNIAYVQTYSYEDINSQSLNKSIGRIAADNSGNVIVTGSFETTVTFGSYTLTNNVQVVNSKNAAFVAKKLTNGTFAWAKAINPVLVSGSTSFVNISNVTTDPAGNCYLTGWFRGKVKFDNIALTSKKSGTVYTSDFFIAKMTGSGVFVYAKAEGTNHDHPCITESGKDIVVDNQGNTYATGYLIYQVIKNAGICNQCYPDVVNYYAPTCIYIVKYNSSGNKLWEKKFFDSSSSSGCRGGLGGTDIQTDGNNIYVAGFMLGTVTFGNVTLNTGGVTNRFLLKMDGNGNVSWAKSVTNNYNTNNGNGAGDELFWDNIANEVYLSGWIYDGDPISFGNCSLSLPSGATTTGYLAKYSASGNCLFAVVLGGTSLGVVRHPNGNLAVYLRIYLQGLQFAIKELSPIDGATLDSLGPTFSPSSDFSTYSGLAKLPDGFIVSQNLYGSYDFGGISVSSVGTSHLDMILLKYTLPTQSSILSGVKNQHLTSQLAIYPSPVENEITIRNTHHESLGDVIIYNASGKRILQKFFSESETNIDVTDLTAGIYFIRSGQFTMLKFIKQ